MCGTFPASWLGQAGIGAIAVLLEASRAVKLERALAVVAEQE